MFNRRPVHGIPDTPGDPDLIICTGWFEARDRRFGFQEVEVVRPLVLVPANSATIGFIKCLDAQCDFVFVHGAAIPVFDSRRIRFTSAHSCHSGIATLADEDLKHGMLQDPDPDAVSGDAVPQILRRWLQAWRPCFTAPSWEHVLVLVMGALLSPGKRTITSCLRMTGRAQAANFATFHQILNRALEPSRCCQTFAVRRG
jgi:hypothetical protein